MKVAYSDARTLHDTPQGLICAIHWPEAGGFKLFPARILEQGSRPVVGVTSWTPLVIERHAFDPESAVALYLNREGR